MVAMEERSEIHSESLGLNSCGPKRFDKFHGNMFNSCLHILAWTKMVDRQTLKTCLNVRHHKTNKSFDYQFTKISPTPL